MKFYNTNDKFGDPGPFEADSKEQLADEMLPTFTDWAIDTINNGDIRDINNIICEIREEFIKGLERV